MNTKDKQEILKIKYLSLFTILSDSAVIKTVYIYILGRPKLLTIRKVAATASTITIAGNMSYEGAYTIMEKTLQVTGKKNFAAKVRVFFLAWSMLFS